MALGNGGNGVSISGGAHSNRIGTDGNGSADIAERNIISGNLGGVLILNVGTQQNTIAGNYIGTDVTGTAAIGNGLSGVAVVDAANNTIRGRVMNSSP